MKIGIRAHDMGMKSNPREVAVSARELGFNSVQLVLHKAIKDSPHLPKDLNQKYCQEAGQAFTEEGVEVALLGAYFDWFHDEDGTGKAKYIDHLEKASLFGTQIVGTEVEGVRKERWGEIPENNTAMAWDKVLTLAKEISTAAKKTGTLAGIEGAVSHVLSTPQKVRSLVDQAGSENFALIFDLFNFLNQRNFENQRIIIDEALEMYADKLAIVHCKDFLPKPDCLEQVALGKGILDYPYLLERLRKTHSDNITLIFEGITGPEIQESMLYIRNLLE